MKKDISNRVTLLKVQWLSTELGCTLLTPHPTGSVFNGQGRSKAEACLFALTSGSICPILPISLSAWWMKSVRAFPWLVVAEELSKLYFLAPSSYPICRSRGWRKGQDIEEDINTHSCCKLQIEDSEIFNECKAILLGLPQWGTQGTRGEIVLQTAAPCHNSAISALYTVARRFLQQRAPSLSLVGSH